jgi:hypothetical protein
MTASGVWNPNPRRVMRRILVLTDSIRPFDNPCSMAARMAGLWTRMLFCSATNAGMRHRLALSIHRSSSVAACSAGSWKIYRKLSLSR